MKTPLEILYKPLYLIVDIAILALSFHLGHVFRGLNYVQTLNDQVMLLYSIFAWLLITNITGFYKYPAHYKVAIKRYLYSFIGLGLTVTFLAFLFKDARYSRLLLGYYLVSFAILAIIVHTAANYFYGELFRLEHFKRNLLIIGAGRMGRKVLHQIQNHPELGFHVIGFLEDNPSGNPKEEMILGTTDNLNEVYNYYMIHEILIALPIIEQRKIIEIIQFAEQNGIRLHLVPDIHRITASTLDLFHIGNVPVFQFRTSPLDNPYNRVLKRGFDFVFSLIGLIITAPIIFISAIVIKLTSPGPVFFVQYRTGYNQNEFKCYKLRSMRVHDPKQQDSQQASADDPRKTKFGDFIRKTNIDELPQFWNVLKGNMSVVGPRPHMLAHTSEFKERVDNYLTRHFVKPGITGWAQVNGWRGPTDTDEKLRSRVEYDLWYLENWTFWLDLKIILRTVFSNQSRLNAF